MLDIIIEDPQMVVLSNVLCRLLVNKLVLIMEKNLNKAEFEGNYINHSGEVTCAAELFKANWSRSRYAVRNYW